MPFVVVKFAFVLLSRREVHCRMVAFLLRLQDTPYCEAIFSTRCNRTLYSASALYPEDLPSYSAFAQASHFERHSLNLMWKFPQTLS